MVSTFLISLASKKLTIYSRRPSGILLVGNRVSDLSWRRVPKPFARLYSTLVRLLSFRWTIALADSSMKSQETSTSRLEQHFEKEEAWRAVGLHLRPRMQNYQSRKLQHQLGSEIFLWTTILPCSDMHYLNNKTFHWTMTIIDKKMLTTPFVAVFGANLYIRSCSFPEGFPFVTRPGVHLTMK